ncbi:hypothetical protein L249_2207 [Ophiocordyceps polyrhachis-furcata BCC 54312]|uniref:Saccharopine dehydrogenase NADP binding domain-containing protein n=1 Tax=Ophiocordyceps polyrhachis-furcata BCC 54312 TaxID=1330021 RepID=A0A367LP74_9HYPO|nr:hypothetical protein L249_2207 [Ophiocordyceps polyrhachis-furcata BCC 54312]
MYDLVILGASGYTGRLTAEHVAAHLPSSTKWALAGRSKAKLQAVADECSRLSPTMSKPELETVNVDDEGQINALVRKTSLVITTVGPYFRFGEGVVRACAQAGTHYLDCTGEIPWVASMIKKYEAEARQSGAILIPCNGIESAASDLITWSLVSFVKAKLGVGVEDVVLSVHKASVVPSGGTIASAMGVFDHFTLAEMRATREPYVISPVPHPNKPRPTSSLLNQVFGIRQVPDLGLQATSIQASIDAPVVERTWGLLSQVPSRKAQFYGPKFNWATYQKPRNWLHGIAMHWALAVGALVLALVPPARALIVKLAPEPGEGLNKEGMAREEIEYRGTATPDAPGPMDKRAYCRAVFRGSSYQITALFLAQAAQTLLEDKTELPGGFYTPACLGRGYVDRVNRAGFKIDVKMLET